MEGGKAVGPAGAATSEGVLANFFNSLLIKKTGQQGVPGGSPNSLGAQIKSPGNDDCKTQTLTSFDSFMTCFRLQTKPPPSGPTPRPSWTG